MNHWHHSIAGNCRNATTDIALSTQFNRLIFHCTRTGRYTDNAKKGTMFHVMLFFITEQMIPKGIGIASSHSEWQGMSTIRLL